MCPHCPCLRGLDGAALLFRGTDLPPALHLHLPAGKKPQDKAEPALCQNVCAPHHCLEGKDVLTLPEGKGSMYSIEQSSLKALLPPQGNHLYVTQRRYQLLEPVKTRKYLPAKPNTLCGAWAMAGHHGLPAPALPCSSHQGRSTKHHCPKQVSLHWGLQLELPPHKYPCSLQKLLSRLKWHKASTVLKTKGDPLQDSSGFVVIREKKLLRK